MACFNDFDLAVVMVGGRILARAYGRQIYVSKTPNISTTQQDRRRMARLSRLDTKNTYSGIGILLPQLCLVIWEGTGEVERFA